MNGLTSIVRALIIAGIIAGLSAVGGVALLTFRANATEGRVEKIDERQRVLERNQAGLTRDVGWSTEMLKKLLEERRIPVPPPPPIAAPSEE